MAKEAVVAMEMASYERGVQETEIRLAERLADELARCARTTIMRYGQKHSTGQESLLPLSGGALRTSSIQKTSERFQ